MLFKSKEPFSASDDVQNGSSYKTTILPFFWINKVFGLAQFSVKNIRRKSHISTCSKMKPHMLIGIHPAPGICQWNLAKMCMWPSSEVRLYKRLPSLPLSFSKLITLSRTKPTSSQLTFCFLLLFGSYHSPTPVPSSNTSSTLRVPVLPNRSCVFSSSN